ncbi:hypothetical protein D6764_04340 [Candidatus Woesearchaeota archaeon]|nr:MAG: hypothetical protein D6764_04340 [Candidatus Woesearchaeota archaeon]
MKSEFDSLHRGVLGKIGEYDQNIVNIGTEIKAMERVFQKVLPVFTENVNELNRVTEEIRTVLSRKNSQEAGNVEPAANEHANSEKEFTQPPNGHNGYGY